MFYEPTCLDNKQKQGDNLSSNRLINLKILTNNIDNFLVFRQCEQEKAPQMKLEEERFQENLISYVKTYYDLNPMNEKKGIRQMHHDSN